MIIGRKKEIEILKDSYNSSESSFIAVYGRRRVGKTFLIRNTFDGMLTFKCAGIYHGKYDEQLYAFSSSLKEYGLNDFENPNNWFMAFDLLKQLIKESSEKKKVIFLDEVSWMNTQRSDFLRALEHFYNGWAADRKDIMLIICSSVTSWIMKKIIHSKGGLYNRLTNQIFLKPFSLKECEEYSNANNLSLTRKQIIEVYMVIGGVPYYWSFYKKGLSVPQFIDSLFYTKNAQLSNEFKYIFSSLFASPEEYVKIIRALALKNIGLTRQEILKETGIIDTGSLSSKIEDLINCDFIREYAPYGERKRDVIYQLADPFVIFYFYFLDKKTKNENFFEEQINNPIINTWKGLAFERLCLYHSNNIKKALGISAVYTSIYPCSIKKDLEKGIFGSQIDMVIERKDDIINLVEAKFSFSKFVINANYLEEMEKKKSDFVNFTKTKSAIYLTFITVNGVEDNAYSKEIQSFVEMDDLFID